MRRYPRRRRHQLRWPRQVVAAAAPAVAAPSAATVSVTGRRLCRGLRRGLRVAAVSTHGSRGGRGGKLATAAGWADMDQRASRDVSCSCGGHRSGTSSIHGFHFERGGRKATATVAAGADQQ